MLSSPAPVLIRSRPWTYIWVLSMVSWGIVGTSFAEPKRYLAPLGTAPDWSQLDPYQRTITRAEFERELTENYTEPSPEEVGIWAGDFSESDAEVTPLGAEEAEEIEETEPEEPAESAQEEEEIAETEPPPPPYWQKFIEILDDRALILKNSRNPDEGHYELLFAESESQRTVSRYWRNVEEMKPASSQTKPLEGVRIVVDPGHIGGAWAQMEQRWVLIKPEEEEPVVEGEEDTEGEEAIEKEPRKPDIPVKEGEIVLRVAQLLEKKLTAYGARVALVRRELKPVTNKRPEDFLDRVREVYGYAKDEDPAKNYRLRSTSERLFYLTSEIRARADRINERYRPDLVLCLHVNAEAWGNPADPDFVDRNHFHILVNGCFSEGELLQDDQRFDMLLRLLQRIHDEEVVMSDMIAAVMAEEIGLPPYTYGRANARRVSGSPYVWSRNLLATRTYLCPVIFFEPYVMNHELVYNRVQAGEYPGLKEIGGQERLNIYEEYAHSVTQGVVEYFRQNRPYEEAE